MSYSRIADHASMVFDHHRNGAYAAALGRSIAPGAIVLDLGAGLGIHGLLAAAAGAARVYLVEPEPVVQVAAAVARANGLDNRIVILQDRIEDVELPEPVDAILSVFTGNMLFSEDLLPSLFAARDRYLKPGGKLLPDCAELLLAPLCAPPLHQRQVARWSERIQGIDYEAARRLAANELLTLSREELQSSTPMAEGVPIASVDLAQAQSADCDGVATCAVRTAGDCHGLLASIRIRLAGDWLSTSLDAPAVHWSPVYLPIDPPLPLMQGESLGISLRRPMLGDWTWSVSARAGVRRHSTFHSSLDGPAQWRNATPDAAPGLSQRGRRLHAVLLAFAQGKSNSQVAREMALSEQLSLPAAMREVQLLALRWGRKG